MMSVVSGIMISQRGQHPNPGTCDCVSLHGKGDGTDVTKRRIWGREKILGDPG
jgi:hypothetical protein